jgi:hypothetical protein
VCALGPVDYELGGSTDIEKRLYLYYESIPGFQKGSLSLLSYHGPIYTVSQEERSTFWEAIASVILSKNVYISASYSERFPR